MWQVLKDAGNVTHYCLKSTFKKLRSSGPITAWQIEGETTATVTDFIFLGSKITADGDCSHERKALTDLGSILKSRDIAGKGLSTQSYGFPVDIDGHDS